MPKTNLQSPDAPERIWWWCECCGDLTSWSSDDPMPMCGTWVGRPEICMRAELGELAS